MNRYERTIAKLRWRLRTRRSIGPIDPLRYRESLRFTWDGNASLECTRWVVNRPSSLVRKHLQEPVRLP